MENTDRLNMKKRTRIGKMSGVIGIACNCVLAAGKLIVGHAASSVSITADGLNNLSDGASSAVTLLGFRLAEKPADKKHPYGHARIEYVAGLTIAVMVTFIGFELAKSSVERLLSPEPVELSAAAVCVLLASIAVKLLMTLFNLKMGRKINSEALLATAADSRNDVIATAAVLAASAAEHFFDVRADGAMGICVSLFILYSGAELMGKTISPLLGECADPELQRQITEYINGCPMVLGCHDLMIHDYGPGRRYASIHVEIDKNEAPMVCHARIDHMERECLKKYGTHLVIHYDPVITDDPELNSTRSLVNAIIKIRDSRLTIHDFRMNAGENGINLSFDMVLPDDLRGQEQEIKDTVEQALDSFGGKKYTIDITFDMETGGVEEE